MDWNAQLEQRAYLYGGSITSGQIREHAADFLVDERLDFEPFGSGEHDWLYIRKTQHNSQAVADELARVAGVKRSAVSFAGLKDNRAISTQVFTVWRPGGADIDYAKHLSKGIEALTQDKHNKKIRRGAHRANHFTIRVTAIDPHAQSALEQRLRQIDAGGVPNYFGAQRFGHGAQNMSKVLDMFANGARGIPKPLKGLLLSAARSWLFNEQVSERIGEGCFATSVPGEWLNLDGSGSVFVCTDDERVRMNALDVHRTACMWGKGVADWQEKAPEQIDWECTVLKQFSELREGLERFDVEYQRRAIRAKVNDLEWEFASAKNDNTLHCTLAFSLNRGQFATSVLRELFIGVEQRLPIWLNIFYETRIQDFRLYRF